MIPTLQGLIFLILFFWFGNAFAQTSPTNEQKLKSQADLLEDKGAEAIDNGDIDKGLDDMVQAIALDPAPVRRMNYGSILFGNGVAVFKEQDTKKGLSILEESENQLRKAILQFNPKTDQVYLSQCYFLLGEIYLNAYDDKAQAINYYKKSAELSDYSGAKEALSKLTSP